jgi:two-component system sensor histidine kinase AtoS
MYYSDVSCNMENTFKKMEDLGIKKILNIDWMGIVTVTRKNKVFIDGERNYNMVDTFKIIRALEGRIADIFHLQEGIICNISVNESIENIIVSPIRVQDDYKVFYICYSLQRYTERDLTALEFATKVIYENVLLNNEIFQEKSYLENLLNSTEACIIGMDLDGMIKTANRGTIKVLGFDPQEVIGKSYKEMLVEKEIGMMGETINYVANNNKTLNIKEAVFSNKNRSNKFLNLAVSPLNDSKGKVVGIVIIARDITKLKIYETELEQLRQFAALGEIAAGIAHDISNPLMSITGCASILKKYLNDKYKYMEFLDPIIHEVDRINEVVKQMLSYGDITKENSYTMISINEVFEKCVGIIRFYKESKYITIERELSNELPLIKGNNVQLQQAFVNILINAVQAIKNEGIIRIKNLYLIDEDKIKIAITDNGSGINKEQISKIFTPFYSTMKNGIGFGLSIAERVVKKHGGEIKVVSELNNGTTFEIYLPVGRE